MTDALEGSSLQVSNQGSSPAPVESQPAPAAVSAPAPTARQESDGRVFRQPEVDDIVKRAKHEAVERYRRLSVEQPEYARQKYGDVAPPAQSAPYQGSQQSNQSTYGLSQLSQDDVRRMAAEEFQRLGTEQREREQRSALEKDAQRIATEFLGKLSAGKELYQDFDSVVGDVQFGSFPNVVQLATVYAENTADVMYELAKDRTRMAMLETLAERSPSDAKVQMQRFAKSIKDNAEAGRLRHPREPLSQIRPSNAGMDAGGRNEVRDMKMKYKG